MRKLYLCSTHTIELHLQGLYLVFTVEHVITLGNSLQAFNDFLTCRRFRVFANTLIGVSNFCLHLLSLLYNAVLLIQLIRSGIDSLVRRTRNIQLLELNIRFNTFAHLFKFLVSQ